MEGKKTMNEVFVGPFEPTIFDNILFSPAEWEFHWVMTFFITGLAFIAVCTMLYDLFCPNRTDKCGRREYNNLKQWSNEFDLIAVECFLLNVKGYITYDEYLIILQLHAELVREVNDGDGWKHRK